MREDLELADRRRGRARRRRSGPARHRSPPQPSSPASTRARTARTSSSPIATAAEIAAADQGEDLELAAIAAAAEIAAADQGEDLELSSSGEALATAKNRAARASNPRVGEELKIGDCGTLAAEISQSRLNGRTW
jgi:hypothetical protein